MRKMTRTEKRALTILTNNISRSLAKWGRAETPILAVPDVTRLDRHATEVICNQVIINKVCITKCIEAENIY